MNILAVGAHPDDVELGCGGMLLRHLSRDDEVHVVVLTTGEYCVHPDYCEIARTREHEAREACDLMGYTAMEFTGRPLENVDQFRHATVKLLEQVICYRGIGRVYGHGSHDANQHHRFVAEMTLAAARLVPEVLLFETPSTAGGFNPTMAVDVTEEFPVKMKALECFKSQSEKMYMRASAVEGLARHRAFQFRIERNGRDALAEVFQVERLVVR